MLSRLQRAVKKLRPSGNGITVQVALVSLLVIMNTGVVAAADGDIPYDSIIDIFNIIVGLIIAVALVNGALGLLQYMTAGSNVERSSAGKERLYKTGAALIGAAVLKGIVTVIGSTVADSAGVDNPLAGQ